MTYSNKDTFKHEITSALWWGLILIILAILPPILTITVPEAKPESESISTWFQRSGSIMVILAIWVELKMLSINKYMNLHEAVVATSDFPELKVQRCKPYYKAMMFFAFVIAIIGTAIWGYGDLFLPYFWVV